VKQQHAKTKNELAFRRVMLSTYQFRDVGPSGQK